VVAALRPWAEVLPVRTQVNLNTAPREVLSAVLGVDRGTAERLVQARQRAPFESVDAARAQLPASVKLEPARVSVASSFFDVVGRLRLDDRALEEHSVLHRRGSGAAVQVIPVRRERRPLSTPGP
jgi:general secretion pathway protein K